jgi:hypothetical protein
MSQTLDEVAIRQYVWKNPTMQAVAAIICRAALVRSEFYPDTLNFSSVPQGDRNCIGITFRTLLRMGLIEQTGLFRSSEAEGANGRIVFQYTLANRALTEALLERTGAEVPRPQLTLL